jgi:Na+/proline symporter
MMMGTPSEIFAAAPEGFWSPTSGPKYTWFFLMGWLAIHYFMIGAEWAFVQRYLCVPTARDARKSSYLFGGLYLVSPFLWLMPPLLWRISNPIPDGATQAEITNMAENAYILSCQSVLPAGMLGLMLAAMFSATASLVSAQLNVFSGVLTSDIYRAFRPNAVERQLVRVGRLFTVVLGVLVTAIALAIPFLGGAERVIVAATELMVVPLLAPTLWGLFNRKVPTRALWLTAGICFPLGLLFRFALPEGSEGLLGWLHTNDKLIETFIGVVLPLIITAFVAWSARGDSPGWKKLEALERPSESEVEPPMPSPIPALVVALSMGACSLMMTALIFINEENRVTMAIFALILAIISALMFLVVRRRRE